VPVHNKAAELSQCLKALTDCRQRQYELIVVDDQSTENIREVAEQYGAHYLETPWRGGPALGRNVGAKQASGEILLFVDADVVVPPNAVNIVRQYFAQDPRLAALFGSYDDEPFCKDMCSSFKNLMHHHVHQASNTDAVTFWSGCGAIRRQIFVDVGGFNTEKYPTSSIEDIELGMRLVQRMHRIRLAKELQVKHLKKWTPAKLWQTDIFKRAAPWSRLILETRSLPNDLNLAWTSRVSASLVATLLVLMSMLIANLAVFSTKREALIGSLMVLDGVFLISLNWGLYGLFFRKRGLLFAIGATFMHWVYLFYSAATFSICWAVESLRYGLRSADADIAVQPSPSILNDSANSSSDS
jgi:glycosyltransferase involved in cell wall biosynthesis